MRLLKITTSISSSSCIDAGTSLCPEANDLSRQYVKHRTSELGPASGPLDIGAFEFQKADTTPSPAPKNLIIIK